MTAGVSTTGFGAGFLDPALTGAEEELANAAPPEDPFADIDVATPEQAAEELAPAAETSAGAPAAEAAAPDADADEPDDATNATT